MILVVKRIASLIIKQWRGELSFAEQDELEQWAHQSPANAELLEQLTNDETLRKELLDYYEAEEAKDIVWKKIEATTSENEIIPIVPLVVRTRMKYKFAIAAVTIATLITAGVYLTNRRPGKPVVTAVAKTDPATVLPGGNKAILTLANGKKIVLDDVANGMLVKEGNTIVSKTNDGELKYEGKALTMEHSPLTFNTLATPKGGQFTLVLPDKTIVWLNAASSITYPTAFTGAERSVEITGEAYFEVAKNAAKPFRVHFTSADREGEVEVLGTHFNINAYDDEVAVKTTLLEGKVKVSATVNNQSTILKPGEQVSLRRPEPVEGSQTSLSHPIPVETEAAVAWKNGEFLFRKADIETILKQAARWYDLEIEYPNGKPKDLFNGGVRRNVNLDKFLTILEISEVKCKLEGRKLIVYK
jgi:transmembrane sensor